jgi:hypothetical protein
MSIFTFKHLLTIQTNQKKKPHKKVRKKKRRERKNPERNKKGGGVMCLALKNECSDLQSFILICLLVFFSNFQQNIAIFLEFSFISLILLNGDKDTSSYLYNHVFK